MNVTITEEPVDVEVANTSTAISTSVTEIHVLVDGNVISPSVTVTTINATPSVSAIGVMVEETEVQLVEIGIQGPPGPTGTSGTTVVDESLVYLVWGTPTAESANTIEVSASLESLTGNPLTSSLADIQIVVTDGATDNEPSATAILSAAGTPIGTILAGSGTATLTIRTQTGSVKIKVTETGIGNRYLWIKQGGNARLWVRSFTGVQELVFT